MKEVPARTEISDAMSKDLVEARLQVLSVRLSATPTCKRRHSQRPSRELLPAQTTFPEMKRIAVYCGSNKGVRPEYEAAAQELGKLLAP